MKMCVCVFSVMKKKNMYEWATTKSEQDKFIVSHFGQTHRTTQEKEARTSFQSSCRETAPLLREQQPTHKKIKE